MISASSRKAASSCSANVRLVLFLKPIHKDYSPLKAKKVDCSRPTGLPLSGSRDPLLENAAAKIGVEQALADEAGDLPQVLIMYSSLTRKAAKGFWSCKPETILGRRELILIIAPSAI